MAPFRSTSESGSAMSSPEPYSRSVAGIFQHLSFANGSSHELRYFLMPATDHFDS